MFNRLKKVSTILFKNGKVITDKKTFITLISNQIEVTIRRLTMILKKVIMNTFLSELKFFQIGRVIIDLKEVVNQSDNVKLCVIET